MNGNSSKQVLLSVLGIAILVVAVVGVSFAFFSYTKAGNTNNVIQTGEIYTYLNEGTDLRLNNTFPQLTTPADVKDVAGDPGTSGATNEDVGYLKFTVTGRNTATANDNNQANVITYKVYVLEGTAPVETVGGGTPVRMWDTEVSAKLFTNNTDTTNSTITPANGVNTSGFAMSTVTGNSQTKGTVAERGREYNETNVTGAKIDGGKLLATGTFKPAGANAAVITHTYELNLWVNNTVKISDTDLNVNNTSTKYCAKTHSGNPQTDITMANGYNGCELYVSGSGNSSTVGKLAKNEVIGTAGEGETAVTGEYLPTYSNAYYAIRLRVVANTNADNTMYNYTGTGTTYTEGY